MNRMEKNRIAEIRKIRNYSQAQLAKMLGVAQNTVSNWEQGKREPDYLTLKKLCYYLDCSLDYLLGLSPTGLTFVYKDINDFTDRDRLLESFDRLNSTGQQVAVERVEELTKIPDYQAGKSAPGAVTEPTGGKE